MQIGGAKLFAVQALCVWVVLCLPGNIATLYLHHKVSTTRAEEAEDDVTFGNVTTFAETSCDYLSLVPCKVNESCVETISESLEWSWSRSNASLLSRTAKR